MNKNDIIQIFDEYGEENRMYPCQKSIGLKESNFYMAVDRALTKYRMAVAELEAKIYAYEKIIANSNFKAVLSKDKSKKEED